MKRLKTIIKNIMRPLTHRKTYSVSDVLDRVTPLELFVGIGIAAAMITLGVFISTAIHNSALENSEVYYKAAKIHGSREQFEYGMKTGLGNALVFGEYRFVEEISIPELKGKYSYIRKSKEVYTQKTRVVTYTDGDGNTHTTVETYEEWDWAGDDTKRAKTISFLGIEFPSDKFGFANESRAVLNKDTVSEAYQSKISGNYLYENNRHWDRIGDVRYYYYTAPLDGSCTVFASLGGETMKGVDGKDQVKVYLEKEIEEVMDSVASEEYVGVIVFWIFWVILTAAALLLFVHLDNVWLHK